MKDLGAYFRQHYPTRALSKAHAVLSLLSQTTKFTHSRKSAAIKRPVPTPQSCFFLSPPDSRQRVFFLSLSPQPCVERQKLGFALRFL